MNSDYPLNNDHVFVALINGEYKVVIANRNFSRFKTIEQFETQELTEVARLDLEYLYDTIVGARQSFAYFDSENPQERIDELCRKANEFLKPFDIEITESPNKCKKGSTQGIAQFYKLASGEPLYPVEHKSGQEHGVSRRGNIIYAIGYEYFVEDIADSYYEQGFGGLEALKDFEKQLQKLQKERQ